MRVVITYRTKRHLDEAMTYLSGAGTRVHAIRVDVTDRPVMERAAQEAAQVFGKIHVLVNSAGAIMIKPFNQMRYRDWDWLLDVNLTGTFNAIKATVPYIQRHDEGGHIIAISSIFGLFAAAPDQIAYCVSKFALVGLMEALGAELVGTNIGTSVCCPGVVRSSIFEKGPDSAHASDLGLSRGSTAQEVEELSFSGSTRQQGLAMMKSSLPSDPLDVGEAVLRGMQNNDLFILTHPEFESFIQARHELLLGSLSHGLSPTDQRRDLAASLFPNSIYGRTGRSDSE